LPPLRTPETSGKRFRLTETKEIDSGNKRRKEKESRSQDQVDNLAALS